MNTFFTRCFEIARAKGLAAQVFSQVSEWVTYTYKNLTDEVLIQNEQEKHFVLTLERDGRKASRTYAFSPELDAEQVVGEVSNLLEFATPDPAETLPVITDSLNENAAQFDAKAMREWAKRTYPAVLESLRSQKKYGIETIIVGASTGTTNFCNSHGASKSVSRSGSSISIGLNGSDNGNSNSEWLSRDGQGLLDFKTAWTEECAKKLQDKLEHTQATFSAGTFPVAMNPDLSAEMLSDYLGLLSGYAIAEKMTPFSISDLGKSILPDWATVVSLAAGPNYGTSRFFDGNGITTRDLTVVDNGKLKELFLSKAAADRLGMKPNGQSSAVNVFLQGNPPKRDLAGVRFLFTHFAGMHTMDSATGNFALEAEGYEVALDGKVGKFVKNVGVSGNIRSLFSGLNGALNDTIDYGTVRVPTLIFQELNITPSAL